MRTALECLLNHNKFGGHTKSHIASYYARAMSTRLIEVATSSARLTPRALPPACTACGLSVALYAEFLSSGVGVTQ
jgi:hypothetical protein